MRWDLLTSGIGFTVIILHFLGYFSGNHPLIFIPILLVSIYSFARYVAYRTESLLIGRKTFVFVEPEIKVDEKP